MKFHLFLAQQGWGWERRWGVLSALLANNAHNQGNGRCVCASLVTFKDTGLSRRTTQGVGGRVTAQAMCSIIALLSDHYVR